MRVSATFIISFDEKPRDKFKSMYCVNCLHQKNFGYNKECPLKEPPDVNYKIGRIILVCNHHEDAPSTKQKIADLQKRLV